MNNHTVVVGYGTLGISAVTTLFDASVPPTQIVVVDRNSLALKRAQNRRLVTVHGDATTSKVLRHASVQSADTVIVALDDDSTAALVTLTARKLTPKARIIVAAREAENAALLRRCGATSTVVSAETAGRLLGLAVRQPLILTVLKDLLAPDAGFAIAERAVTIEEVGMSPRKLHGAVVGVVRDGRIAQLSAPEVDALHANDRILYVSKRGGSNNKRAEE